jgi:hypothetical protein
MDRFNARDVPYGEPGWKNDVCPCRKAKIEQEENEKLTQDSKFRRYSEMTFETFNVKGRGQIRQNMSCA